ncbi:MAG: aminotransferase class IV, partial [Candidatus Omnitrophica bacterium]|nr:aminotransferase class IV [Candidatus Omnitrophota bacterium]
MKNLSLALLFLDGKPTENLEFLSVDFLNEKQVNVFETMRVENGTIFRLTEHLDRLYASMQTVGLSIAKNRESLKKEIYKALEQVSKKKICFLRITIIGPHPIILIFDRAYPESIYQQGIDLVTAAVKRNASNALPPEAKTNQFLNAILSYSKKGQVFTLRQKSRRDPSTKQSMRFLRQISPALWRANLSPFEFETLFLDVNGYVKECRVSN